MKFLGGIVLIVAAILGFALIGGLIVQLAWNYLMPELLGLPEITFWQAVVLTILCNTLFRGSSTSSSSKS